MKVNWNRKYTTIAVYALLVIALAALFVIFLWRFDSITKGFSWVGSVASPVICGVVIAYILNPLMMYFENRIFRKLKYSEPPEENLVMRKLHNSSVGDSTVVKTLEKHSTPMEKKIRRRKSAARILSLSLTFIVVFAVLAGVIIAVVPSVANSLVDLTKRMPAYLNQFEDWAEKIFEDNPQILQYISAEVTSFADMISKLAESLRPMAGDILGGVSSEVFKFVGNLIVVLKNVIIGFIIAIYLLYSKERLLAQAKKILIAFLKKERCVRLFSGFEKSNDIFKKYIISNLLDAMIIFVFMLIGMFAMGMPYQTLIAVVCGITNLIPFFGPFIGAIPCGVLILLDDPVKVIWFGIFVLVLQQIDGNIIKPFLFGETMGLPAIWVLISIVVGGGFFGIPGMLLGAPVFAVFYLLFAEFVSGKLRAKNLPGETEAYVGTFEEFSNDYFVDPPEEYMPSQQTQEKNSPAPPERNASSVRADPPKPAAKPQIKKRYHKK